MASLALSKTVRGFSLRSNVAVMPVPRARAVCRASMTGSNIVPWPDDMYRDTERRDGTPVTEPGMQTNSPPPPQPSPTEKRGHSSSKKKAKKAIMATMPYSHARYFGWMVVPK